MLSFVKFASQRIVNCGQVPSWSETRQYSHTYSKYFKFHHRSICVVLHVGAFLWCHLQISNSKIKEKSWAMEHLKNKILFHSNLVWRICRTVLQHKFEQRNTIWQSGRVINYYFRNYYNDPIAGRNFFHIYKFQICTLYHFAWGPIPYLLSWLKLLAKGNPMPCYFVLQQQNS